MARSTWTRKTYIMVAEMLRITWTQKSDEEFRNLADNFAIEFGADNPSFDRQRFMVAIGLES